MEWFAPSYPVRQTVIVNLTTGKAFRGVLWQRTREHLVLRNAELHEHGKTMPIDGEIVIERGKVDFVQVLRA